jgi:hypothetical protein
LRFLFTSLEACDYQCIISASAMPYQFLTEIVARPDTEHSTVPVYEFLYDAQSEIQACMAWLKAIEYENEPFADRAAYFRMRALA